MLEASVVVIGDEILGGFVEDTNSSWLVARLREQGVSVARIHTVPDDADAIDEALQAELARRRPRLVLTTGGVGSTPDDLTYEAVAASLDLELTVDPQLAERVEGALEWTRAHGVEVDEEFRWHMMRMARVPDGARLLAPDASWSPGVRVDVDGGIDVPAGATVVMLPGVPSQLRSVFRAAVDRDLLAGHDGHVAVAELTHGFPESALNTCFARLLTRYPDVKLGSYPGVPMLVRLRGPREHVEAALEELRTFVRELEDDPAGVRLREAWTARLGGSERG